VTQGCFQELVAAERLHHVEHPRTDGAPGQGDAQRLGDTAELELLILGEGANSFLHRNCGPWTSMLQALSQTDEHLRCLIREMFDGIWLRFEGSI